MPNFVELWVYLASAPLFGLTATLSVYVLAQALSVRAGYAPWANPVMLSVAALATLMLATGTAYPTYFAGAQFIHFLLGPAVVALGWPLWQRRAALRARWARLVLASLAGGSAAAASAMGLGWALGLSGLPLAVMIVAASLPVGANVFLFAQRYRVAEDEVTASVAVSTALALVTMPVVILAVTRWVL